MYPWTNPPSIPPRVRDKISGTTSSIEGVLTDFPTPVLPKISGELVIETMIDIHWLISGNANDCDNEHHASAAENVFIDGNKSNKNQEEVLLFDIRKKLYSWK